MTARPILANLVLFGRALRSAGLPVTHGQTVDFARALELVDLENRNQVFHAGRSLLVSCAEDLAVYEVVFDLFWRPRREGASRIRRAASRRDTVDDRRQVRIAAGTRPPAAGAAGVDRDVTLEDRSRTYSAEEVLRQRDFAELLPEELDDLRRLILDMNWSASERRTRRWRPAVRGARLDLGRILRQAARFGGAPIRLTRRQRKTKRRPVVLLADVSGSMEKYSRILLQFFYGAVHGLGPTRVECFVFGTRLTRITASLRIRNVDRALRDASDEIVDFSGGTRIGACLGSFNRLWARRLLRRGAVVLVASDGWERGDVGELAREIRYLQHRCHRLIWLNPHAGRTGYEPLVEGMRAALPYVDEFLPMHNLDSLRALGDVLARLPAGRRHLARRRVATGECG